MIPETCEGLLGASLPIVPGTNLTGFTVVNGAISGYMRSYAIFGTNYGTIKADKYHHECPLGYWGDIKSTTGTKVVSRLANGSWKYVWTYDNVSYTFRYTSIISGNLWHYKRNSGDNSPNLRSGSYSSEILTKSTGKWVTTTSTAHSNLTFSLWTPPIEISSNLTELVLAEVESAGGSSFTRDLLDLSTTKSGNEEWQASQHAVDSLNYFNGSTLEMLRDAYHWKQLKPPLKAFANVASPRSWAEVFLWFKYGVLPTIMDARDIVAAFQKYGKRSLSDLGNSYLQYQTRYGTVDTTGETFRGYPVTHKCNIRVTLRPAYNAENALEALFAWLKSINLVVSARNVWELVPYSFVVDWFVNTSSLMTCIDSTANYSEFKLKLGIKSHKRSVLVESTDYFPGTSGHVELVSYERAIFHSFPEASFEFEVLDPSSHWLEGSALLVARKK